MVNFSDPFSPAPDHYIFMSNDLLEALGEAFFTECQDQGYLLMGLDGLRADCQWPEHTHCVLASVEELDEDFFELFNNNPNMLLLDFLRDGIDSTSLQKLRELLDGGHQRFWFPYAPSRLDDNLLDMIKCLIRVRMGCSLIAADWFDLCAPARTFSDKSDWIKRSVPADQCVTELADSEFVSELKNRKFAGRLVILSIGCLSVDMEAIMDTVSSCIDESEAVFVAATTLNIRSQQHDLWVLDYG